MRYSNVSGIKYSNHEQISIVPGIQYVIWVGSIVSNTDLIQYGVLPVKSYELTFSVHSDTRSLHIMIWCVMRTQKLHAIWQSSIHSCARMSGCLSVLYMGSTKALPSRTMRHPRHTVAVIYTSIWKLSANNSGSYGVISKRSLEQP